MGEQFGFSLISKKGNYNKDIVKEIQILIEGFLLKNATWINEFQKGDIPSSHKFFLSENDSEIDYDEIFFSIESFKFQKDRFEKQLSCIEAFAEFLFDIDKELIFILCSYELNGYLLSNVKRLKYFDNKFLEMFPFVFSRFRIENKRAFKIAGLQNSFFYFNLNAQDIF